MSEEHFDKIRERMAQEELVQEKTDAQGYRWKKVYFGGGSHFRNWLEQCRELGEVEVEEIDPTGFKCYEQDGEKVYRIWVKAKEMANEEKAK
jgi:hypothetical protein